MRGGGPSPCSLVVYGRMRERQRGRYCERTCEEQECVGQTHTIQVFLIVAESLVTVEVSKVVWNLVRMDLGEEVHTPDLLEDTRAAFTHST